MIWQYSDNSGFINWKNVSTFINEAVKLLEECTDSLIEWKRYFEAFEIVSYYYDEILTTDLDDDGDISFFQNCCLEMLSTIADESDIKTRCRLFNAAFRKMDTSFSFFNELNKVAEHTADRPTYKRWADKLRHMKTIKGGIETADMIIDRWRELYCNRRAMMQEINKVADESDYGIK